MISNPIKTIAKRILLTPAIKDRLERIYLFYEQCRLERLPSKEVFIERFTKALESGQPDLVEGLSIGDTKALKKLVDGIAKGGVRIAEIGSWKGHSTSVLARVAQKHNGQVFAIDHWEGNEETGNLEIAKAYDIYAIFKRNMILLGLWDRVHPLVMDSYTASQIFADETLDLIFIDADHRFEYFKQDILSWLPKLKRGGILCGHDCEKHYSDYPERIKNEINEHLGDDYIPHISCHPGVTKALYDLLQGKCSIMPNSTIWYCIKTEAI